MYNLWDTSSCGGAMPEPETRTAMMHHSMMQLCRVDFPPFKMQAHHQMQGIPGQMYAAAGHNQFEGILELRKEKSRDAARSRRGKENYEFYELAKMLPLPGAITSQLDKASIIRLTIANLKLKDFSCHGDPPWQRDGAGQNGQNGKGGASRRRSLTNYATEVFETHQGTHILQSLDGFGFTLSNDGRFLYISETVSIYLGLSQVEMTGSTIFDYVHPADQQELAEQLGLSTSHHHPTTRAPSPATSTSGATGGGADEDAGSTSGSTRAASPPVMSAERGTIMAPSPSDGLDRCFCLRMKSTLTKRGVHMKSSGYRVIQIMGHHRPQYSFSMTRKHPPPILGFVAVATALPPPTITELFIDNDMFVSRLGPDFTVTYVEPRIGDMMDLGADDLTNQNLYNHCHAEDLKALKKAHEDLLSKGQVLTDYYRLMNKHGGFIWIQTCATVLHNAKNPDEQNIIAINYVLSGVEYPGCIMNTRQLKTVTYPGGDQSDHSENEHGHTHDQFKHDPSPPPPDNGPNPSSSGRSKSTNHGHQTRHQNYSASSQLPVGGESGAGGMLLPLADQATTPDISAVATTPSVPSVNQILSDFETIPPAIANAAVSPADLFCNRTTPSQGDGSANTLDTNMNSMYSEDERIGGLNGDANGKLIDNKNSRRKMDKPRKRKRDSTDTDNESDIFQSPNSKSNSCGVISDSPSTTLPSLLGNIETSVSLNGTTGSCASSIRADSVHSTITPTSPNTVTPKSISTPVPEDLTVQITSPTATTVTSPGVSTPSSVQVPLTPRLNGITTDSDQWPIESACLNVSASALNTDLVSSANSSSVRDLEEVMNKHLPVSAQMDAEMRHEYAQSFLGGFGKHKSTIQWVGSNNTGAQTTDMTASNLLRSLYANRETVIRTNVYNPRPQYYSDMQSSLLTPPGATTDPYKDSFQVLNAAAHSKNQPASYGNGLSYPSNSLSVSMPTPGAIPEGFNNMTPPSSVSPHEKYPSALGADQMHYGTSPADAGASLKTQGYPLPAHGNALGGGAFERTAANQYVPYYGNGPGIPAAGGYGHTVHYREPTKNGAW